MHPSKPSTTFGRCRRTCAASDCILPMAFCSAMSRTLHVLSKITSAAASVRASEYPLAASCAATASESRSFIWHP